MGFFDIVKSIFRGGAVKNIGKKAVKGIKGLFTKGGSKVVKGIKRGGVKVVRGVKKTKAQVKAIPETITRAKALNKQAKRFTMSKKERRGIVIDFIKKNMKDVGKEALRKDGLERFADKLGRNVAKVRNFRATNATFKKLLDNSRRGESYYDWGLRNTGKLIGKAKNLVQTVIREGGENLAVDATMGLAGKLAIGTATAGASAGVTAGIVKGTQ